MITRRIDGVKVIVISLIKAIPDILGMLIILMLFMLIFGITCISYFKGTMYQCQKLPEEAFIPLIVDKWDCLSYGGEWENYFFNFDNVLRSTTTLFKMASAYQWLNVMYLCTSIVDINMQPVYKDRLYWSIFFIFFMIVVTFFLFNIFVGIVINKFKVMNETEIGLQLLSDI